MVLQAKKVLFFSLVAIALFLPAQIFAATLSIVPSLGSYTVGQTFIATVRVSSADRALNAISGTVNYPSDKLEVLSVNKVGSLLSYWITEPVATVGQVKFEGVVPNPGFIGVSGTVLNITFRARLVGEAPVTFSTGSVLANDGLGTEILANMFPASFAIKPVAPLLPPPESTTPVVDFAPPAREVTSSTHPNPSDWYANDDPIFSWKLDADISGVNILADKIANTNPGINSDGLLKTYQYDNVADGEWYFHLRLRNSQGWGGVTHFGFKVDMTKPEQFDLSLPVSRDPRDPRLEVLVSASDKTSGVDRYEFSLDGKAPVTWQDDGSHAYHFVASSGSHVLIAKVYDRAGNYLQDSLEFTVDLLVSPRITDYPAELPMGELLKVGGETYPEAHVFLTLTPEQGELIDYEVWSDASGHFTVTADRKLQEGVYCLTATVLDERGARSEPSQAVVIAVTLSPFWKLGLLANNTLSVVVPALAMLLLIIFLIWYSWHKMKGLRKRVRKESREAEEALHQAFELLRTDLAEGVERLENASDKRELTKDEKALLRQFRKSLDEAEKFVHKEIVDIEKEVD